jgi:hypothetical protein
MAETILITGARAPAALDLARAFAAAGAQVHMADCAPAYMARLSNSVGRCHRLPSPREDFSAFAHAVYGQVARLAPAMVIPTCEEVFHLAALPALAPRLFAPPLAALHRLHSKFDFLEDARALGLAAPRTVRLQSTDDLNATLPTCDRLVYKPEFSRFGVHTLIAPQRDRAAALQPNAHSPWVAQECIAGQEVSFYAVSVDARLTAFSAYRSAWKFTGGAGYAFESLDPTLHDALKAIASTLAAHLIPRGQFACDVIIDAHGQPRLLECNPRATSGVHLFDRTPDLADAFFGKRARVLFARPGVARHVGPALWSFGLKDAVQGRRFSAWRAQRRKSQDVISVPGDGAPLLGALWDTVLLGVSAVRRGVSLTAAATADIEWNGERHAAPRAYIASPGDDGLCWGDDQAAMPAYLAALTKPGVGLSNADVESTALQMPDRAFAVLAPARGAACWIVSLCTLLGRTARQEVARETHGMQALAFTALSLLAEAILRGGRADRAVYPNHVLLSTSLYGDWRGDGLEDGLNALRAAYPNHAIIWRSLTQEDNAALLARMAALGGRMAPCRVTWRIENPAQSWAVRRDVRDDRALMRQQGFQAEAAIMTCPDDLRSALGMYASLYLHKYSNTNPAYRLDWLHAAVQSGLLRLRVIRNAAGDIEAFCAEHTYQGVMTIPLLGHDPACPQTRGLYRAAMAASMEHALQNGLRVNLSAGAGAFKRNRGAKPALEFCVIFCDHLPAYRRAVYGGLTSSLRALAPTLQRIATR